MKYHPDKHHRRSIRLKDYDYSQQGAYFVTVCTYKRECFWGNVIDEEMRLNEYGNMVWEIWNEIPVRFPHAENNLFVAIPNHVHGIMVITDNCRGGVTLPQRLNQAKDLGEETSPLRKPSLGKIVAYFKYQTTKRINEIRRSPGDALWQRNYYEHIIRDEDELNRIRQYILNNPLQWHWDRENPLSENYNLEYQKYFMGICRM